MNSDKKTIRTFAEELASPLPAPGGGGVAALVGALSAGLVSMSANLTIGKKKYADVEPDMRMAVARCWEIGEKLLMLIDRDEECFLPLAEAYSLPKDAPDYENIRRNAVMTAASAPLEILQTICTVLPWLKVLYDKGSRLMLSDVGCAAELCVSAAKCAAMNVLVNTRLIPGDKEASDTAQETSRMVKECLENAGRISAAVLSELSGD